jgi:hypothetical protein
MRSQGAGCKVPGVTSLTLFATGCANVVVISAIALWLTAFTALAQSPRAQDEAMPLLRDASRVALRNVRIIDGTGAPARQNQTLIIESGRIRAVGSATEITVPEGTRTLDLDGRTVLPGYVMLHEHMFYASENDNTHPQPFTSPRLSGVRSYDNSNSRDG